MWVTKVKGSPYFHVRFEHPDGTGAIISKSTKCAKRREALARGREIEAEFAEEWKQRDANAPKTSKQVIDEYWETEAKLRKAGLTHIFPHLNRIDQFLGDKLYHLVTVADVAKFIDTMQASGFSPATINRAISVWRRMHNLAAKVRLYPVKMIPWKEVRKEEPSERDAHLTPEQIKAIFASLTSAGREISMFALLVGLRKSQVLTLTWDRVDFENATITVYRKHRKQNARHTIPIHDAALRILEKRKQDADGELVFDVVNFRNVWESAVDGAGLKGQVRFHDLRHAFATLAARTTPLHILQELLGHSNINMTRRYAHARDGDMRLALKKLPVIDI